VTRFCAALLVVALAFPLWPWIVYGQRPGFFLDFTVITVGATLLGLLPSTLLLVREGWLRAWQITAAGAFVGVVVGALIAALFALGPSDYLVLLSVLAYGGVFGALHGLVFWLLAVFKNAALVSWVQAPPAARR
jgi:hypothetical protein